VNKDFQITYRKYSANIFKMRTIFFYLCRLMCKGAAYKVSYRRQNPRHHSL